LPATNSIIPGRKVAKAAAAAGGGLTVTGAVIYYLLTTLSAQGDRIKTVESEIGTVKELRTDVRQLTVSVGEMGKDVAAIKGYIKGRDQ
jgi:hypothetical protein